MNFTTAMKVSGTFTVANALAANLSNKDITLQVTSYVFMDGINTYSNTDPNSRLYLLVVNTNASGSITTAGVLLQKWLSGTSPHTTGDLFAQSGPSPGETNSANNFRCNTFGVSPSGTSDVCESYAANNTAFSSAFAPAGVWTSPSTNVPTLGEWGTMFLVLLLVAFGVWRLRRQRHPAAA